MNSPLVKEAIKKAVGNLKKLSTEEFDKLLDEHKNGDIVKSIIHLGHFDVEYIEENIGIDNILNTTGYFDTTELQKYFLNIQALNDVLNNVRKMTVNDYNKLFEEAKEYENE